MSDDLLIVFLLLHVCIIICNL